MHAYPRPAASISDFRKFGFLIGGVVAVFFGAFSPWRHGHAIPLWPWIFASVLVGVAVLFPQVLKPFYAAWMRLGDILGWVNSKIVMAILFYLCILPVGLLMRLGGKDPMARRTLPDAKSYRIPREVGDLIERMERPF